MKILYAFLIFLTFSEEVPFKAKEAFEVNLGFEFKSRVHDNTVVYSQATRVTSNNSSGPLPYLKMDLKVLALSPEEIRVRVVDDKKNVIMSKKVVAGDVIKLDLGFTDDIKDGISSRDYIFYFMSQDKKPLTRVHVHFQNDGAFYINEEPRGKV
jgi:hypothetical protein